MWSSNTFWNEADQMLDIRVPPRDRKVIAILGPRRPGKLLLFSANNAKKEIRAEQKQFKDPSRDFPVNGLFATTAERI